jgi:hypothetical protein
MPTLTDAHRAIARQTLPSTSAAHARLSFADKEARWSVLFEQEKLLTRPEDAMPLT